MDDLPDLNILWHEQDHQTYLSLLTMCRVNNLTSFLSFTPRGVCIDAEGGSLKGPPSTPNKVALP